MSTGFDIGKGLREYQEVEMTMKPLCFGSGQLSIDAMDRGRCASASFTSCDSNPLFDAIPDGNMAL